MDHSQSKSIFVEEYGRLENSDRSFDRRFWQAQGAKAIFDAAYDLIRDYWLLKENYADEPRIQRTLESFGKQ